VIAVNPDSDSVTIVDAASLEVIREASVGRDPRTVAFGPDGSVAFVANHESGAVTRIDLRSGSTDRERAGVQHRMESSCPKARPM
jgi:YVTN family beta-propeller protein